MDLFDVCDMHQMEKVSQQDLKTERFVFGKRNFYYHIYIRVDPTTIPQLYRILTHHYHPHPGYSRPFLNRNLISHAPNLLFFLVSIHNTKTVPSFTNAFTSLVDISPLPVVSYFSNIVFIR